MTNERERAKKERQIKSHPTQKMLQRLMFTLAFASWQKKHNWQTIPKVNSNFSNTFIIVDCGIWFCIYCNCYFKLELNFTVLLRTKMKSLLWWSTHIGNHSRLNSIKWNFRARFRSSRRAWVENGIKWCEINLTWKQPSCTKIKFMLVFFW